MDFAIVGGDARMEYLARLMRTEGRDARLAAAGEPLPQAKNILLSGPAEVESIPETARLWTFGPSAPRMNKAVDLWKDERLKLENAYLTAEGAVCAAMNAGKKSMKDCRCLVIGWGRIGRALTEILIGLNAPVTVASRREQGRHGAAVRGAESISTFRLPLIMPDADVIFSTAPAKVLGEEALCRAKPDALILDLASAPYGVDLDAARSLNLRAWREPALPGRYCPYSAALAILNAIHRAERRLNRD